MERKKLTFELKQDGEEGEVTARFATLNVIDKDGDITLPGAFGQQDVNLAAWGHNWGIPPVGDGKIRESGNAAVFDGVFYTDTNNGSEHYKTMKRRDERGIKQEWSYGYDVKEYSLREPEAGETAVRYDGMIRILKRLEVIEVSPVMIGAGVDTRTEAVKSGENSDAGLALLRKFKAGDAFSNAETEELAGMVGATPADVGKLLGSETPPADTPPADDPPLNDPEEPKEADPAEARKLFMEFQQTTALVRPRRD